MRIISGLAAGLAAIAIGSAAEARPGGAGSGHGASPPGVWFKTGGNHGGKGGYGRSGPGAIGGDRHHGRHEGRDGRSGRYGRNSFDLYGGGGIAGPVGEVDPYGNGFFNGGGGRIRLRGGHPYFDYDRAYPYEWASAAPTRQERPDEARASEPPPRCSFENGVRVCRGW
jgi:hypothetical protein